MRSLFFLFLTILICTSTSGQSFKWPEGKKAALSLTFDDARQSDVNVGLPVFKKHKALVTFYVLPSPLLENLGNWKQAVADGHEIGNHTLVHPCSGNFEWSRDKALENYSLESMRAELISANQQIVEILGVKPKSFAYSCGQTFVGRGTETRSYVPLIAELFSSGRGWLDEAGNDPEFADMAQLQGIEMDGKDFSDILPILENAKEKGLYVVLAGHEIGANGFQTTRVSMLEELLAYVQRPENGIWLAPVGTVTDYLNEYRQGFTKKLAKSLTFCASFDDGYEAEFAAGDPWIYTAPQYDQLDQAAPGMSSPSVRLATNAGRYGHALHFERKTPETLFFWARDNFNYATKDWSGTISLWLSLDPGKDLEPGYTDPIQITDVGYNDAALWVDFSDKNPRDFRMGVYGDLKIWNPENISPDQNPAFNERLLPAKDLPFGRNIWTHIAISFKHLNTQNGAAEFFINGKSQGIRSISEPFTWDLEKARIFLGLNYTGWMDEVMLFDVPLDATEIRKLYQLPEGASTLLKQKRSHINR